MWLWHVKMATQNFLKLLLLWKGCWGCYCCLMLMLRNVLTIVWCRFGSWSLVIKSNFCPDFEHKVWSRFWSWSSGEILKLKFSQYFAADPWLRLWRLFLVEILKLRLVLILKFKFSWYADIWLRFWSCCLVKNMKMKSERFVWKLVIWPREITLVIRTQPSGPLCLWQCFQSWTQISNILI